MSSIRSQQLSSVEIEFDDKIRILIIRDLILSKDVHRRDENIDNAQNQAFVTESKGRSIGPNDRAKFNDKSQLRDRS